MTKITEQQILAMAPNAAAAANGKKIWKNGGFVRLQASADETFYLGECTGSGKSSYITSADFLQPEAPVCRCTCPSRQFPCKHGLALLYVIQSGQKFETCEIPEDILSKRAKKQARDARAEAKASEISAQAAGSPEADNESGAGTSDGDSAAAAKAPSKASLNARKKKMQTQLEGLQLTEKLVQDLMTAGLGTMGGTAKGAYENLVKQLGDYYLPGPQRLLNGLLLEINAFQKDGKEVHYDNAIDIMEKLWNLLKKSRTYLETKLADGDLTQDDSLLFEELGGVWKMAELEALGRVKKNTEFLQLAFWVTYDEARREYIDISCWSDLSDGNLYLTKNYRPVKALKHVKEENSIFGVAYAEKTVIYPGEGNLRIRWEHRMIQPMEPEHLEKARSAASDSLAAEAKAAKNLLKNPMAEPMLLRLVKFQNICRVKAAEGAGPADGVNDAERPAGSALEHGAADAAPAGTAGLAAAASGALAGAGSQAGGGVVLVNKAGENILLGDMSGMEETTLRLSMLPEELVHDQVLLGGFWYDQQTRKLKLQPISILTDRQIIRLLY